MGNCINKTESKSIQTRSVHSRHRSRHRYPYRNNRNNHNQNNNQTPTNNSKKAILVGLNYVGTRAALQGCINDANRMSETLRTKYGYDHVNVLTDDHITFSYNILQILSQVIASGSKNMFFQYSGHGTQVHDHDRDENDGKDEALYSKFGTIITDDEIYREVQNVQKGSKLVLVIDACHSGTMIDLPYQLVNGKALRINHNHVDGDVVCITGCRDDQVSMDISEGNTAYGAMSNALQHLLKTLKPGTTWKQLVEDLNKNLRLNKMAQVPQLCVSREGLLDEEVDF